MVSPIVIINSTYSVNALFSIVALVILAIVAVWVLVAFVVGSVYDLAKERKYNNYLATIRCKGITLKNKRCSKYDCSISHKSYLD